MRQEGQIASLATICWAKTKARLQVFFLRHAESLGNAKGIYGGWEDAALSLKGEQQATEVRGPTRVAMQDADWYHVTQTLRKCR